VKRTRFGGLVVISVVACMIASSGAWSQVNELFRKPKNAVTRWSSFENLSGVKGQGGKENDGAKGHAFDSMQPGESKVLLDVTGSGMITRMWFTLNNRKPEMLRALKFEIFWDSAETPAVSVPFGDFFGAILGRPVTFESELFSNPEGRSFNCFIPMPFRKGAKVVLTNESDTHLRLLFFDIDYVIDLKHDRDVLYFHAFWRRENPTTLGEDFTILPKVKGSGRFLGTNIGVIADAKNIGWWGEGEVKMYLDGDGKWPTIVGTGTEDYIGTGWGQGTFDDRYQGSLISDKEKGLYTFYRYHVPDPVYFEKDLRVTIQQIGGFGKMSIIKMLQEDVPIIPVSVAYGDQFVKLLDADPPIDLETADLPTGPWTNYYRQDDVCAVAYFYLDDPENGLPPLAPIAERTADLGENDS